MHHTNPEYELFSALDVRAADAGDLGFFALALCLRIVAILGYREHLQPAVTGRDQLQQAGEGDARSREGARRSKLKAQ